MELIETEEACMVKFRTFVPKEMAQNLFDRLPVSCYEQNLYDRLTPGNSWKADLGEDGKFCRMRRNKQTGEEKWFLRQTISNNADRHMYFERLYSQEEAEAVGLKCFLSYEFKKIILMYNKKLENNVVDREFTVALDTITSHGIDYSILVVSCCFKKIEWTTIIPIARQWIFYQLIDWNLRPLPVYTKDMYVLRFSKDFALFHDVFEERCSSDSIDNEVEILLKLKHVVDKEYIWVFDQAPGIFKSCMTLGFDVPRTMKLLCERREMMLSNDRITFLSSDCL